MTKTRESSQIEALLRSHVEAALRELRHWSTPEPDADGDYPFRADTSACWVRIVGGPDPSVQVFGHAANDVPRSAKMLAEINELNRQSRWTKVFWINGCVISEATLHWTLVDAPSLDRVMGATCAVCDDIGPMIAAVFGGETPLQPLPAPAEDESDAA
jgi:hypothetical protein